ncbi:MAG: hypothetical protein KAH17_02280 [Bacteroidales bacterium]|nr:hypothetical protein [Bacteroidales bacterium]
MKKIIFLSSFLLLTILISSEACTTAVVSGKYTPDGRPLLWKHRDTWALNNKVMQFTDGKYAYTGLVNSTDPKGKSIWGGFNSAGFAIMNSASYNLNNDTITQSGLEGRLMKEALQTCATIDDFEELLKGLTKPIRLESNFGVIDAQGGAAYFELGNFKYVKIDANDPKVAPFGYLIRTNYSTTGKMGIGGGYIRYVTADKAFKMAVKEDRLTAKTILQEFSRDLTHSLTNTDLNDYDVISENQATMVMFQDYIPRKSTSSSLVVQGVKKGENPVFTTMWTTLGSPLTSVTIPIWLSNKTHLPMIVSYDQTIKDSPLCHLALELKKECFPYEWGTSSKYYMNINAVINADHTGTLQVLKPLEDEVFGLADEVLLKWRNNEIDYAEMQDFYDNLDVVIPKFYSTYFNLNLK